MIRILYGEEKILIEKDIDKIIEKENIEKNSIIKYDMNEKNISDAINDYLTISMFGDKKLIICEDAFFLSTKTNKTIEHNVEDLKKILEEEIDNKLILIVDNEKLDTRKKIVKELEKKGLTKKVSYNEADISKYILKAVGDRNRTIDIKTANYLKEKTKGNIPIIDNEINKLCLYKNEQEEISVEDIDKLVSKTLEDNIFDLIDNILKNNKKRTFEIYNDLILMKEEPIKIIVMLANQIRLIYQVKLLIRKGYMESDIAKEYKIHPYRVKLANNLSKSYSEELLQDYLMKLSDLDIKIKTGTIDKNIGLELFFIKM